jgi:PEP-CTERM/exosortase A-associated glycosyltransferase
VSLRVLHVLDHSWPVLDGYAQRSRSIVKAQVQLGMDPCVVTSPLHQLDDPEGSEASLDGVRYLRTPHHAGFEEQALRRGWPFVRELTVVQLLRRRIESLLEKESVDIIHAHSPSLCGLAAMRAARAARIPFVYELRSFWEDAAVDQGKTTRASLRYLIARRLETYVVQHADAVVGIARPILQDLEARGIAKQKLFYVSNGVDSSRFQPRARDCDLMKALHLPDVSILGFIGTLFPWEGVPWLVRAVAALRKSGVPFQLLIVGDGADREEIRRVTQEQDASDYVSFVGRVPHEQVERYYSVMDVLVYPRRSMRLTELVTPLKPLEAMASAKAILGSDVGGIRELVEPEVTGVLFRSGDLEDFGKQALRLLKDPELRSKLGEEARRKVIAEREWKVLAHTYETAYAWARQAPR